MPQLRLGSAELASWPRWDGNLPDGVDPTTGEGGVRVRIPDTRDREQLIFGGGGGGGGGTAAQVQADSEFAYQLQIEFP